MTAIGAPTADPGRVHPGLRIVILGLSITSSWGNGHATTFRSLVRALGARGHEVLFLERDQPWYAENRDLPNAPYGRIAVYGSVRELRDRFTRDVRDADLVVVGSYVPDGIAVGEWVTTVTEGLTAFYDIDTPVTIARVARDECDYLSRALIGRYDLYLSFTGGPILERIARLHHAPCVRALYCGCDPDLYRPDARAATWDLGYLGTYSADRQPMLDRLLLEPARRHPDGRFAVAGAQYPETLVWPDNVERVIHLSPPEHRAFYTAQRFTLNITRVDMVRAGYAPSVRLFEAAACEVPIISDEWEGLPEFFAPGREILIARSSEDVLDYLLRLPHEQRMDVARRARERVLAEHTAAHRAAALEQYISECRRTARTPRRGAVQVRT